MSKTVADVLVGTLEQIGVKYIFGLIGDSLNPLADAVRRSRVEWIGVRHEEGAALAAAGQAKLTGQLAVCAGTTGPGSNHLVAGLYEACRDHAPVLALSGDMPRKFHGTDYIQTTEPDLLFRDVSLYTETIASVAQAAAVIHQAIAAAYAGPGVAHLTLPQDVLEGRGQRFQHRHPQTTAGICGERAGHCRDGASDRCHRPHRDHVRRRLSQRDRGTAQALGSPQGAADPFVSRQGIDGL
jgi:thiamine pyrophosphate-dependent acetolactate synthase large subunit-like protein